MHIDIGDNLAAAIIAVSGAAIFWAIAWSDRGRK